MGSVWSASVAPSDQVERRACALPSVLDSRGITRAGNRVVTRKFILRNNKKPSATAMKQAAEPTIGATRLLVVAGTLLGGKHGAYDIGGQLHSGEHGTWLDDPIGQ